MHDSEGRGSQGKFSFTDIADSNQLAVALSLPSPAGLHGS